MLLSDDTRLLKFYEYIRLNSGFEAYFGGIWQLFQYGQVEESSNMVKLKYRIIPKLRLFIRITNYDVPNNSFLSATILFSRLDYENLSFEAHLHCSKSD